MKEEKDYGELNNELLGVLVTTDGAFTKKLAMGMHSTDYYVTQAVANELANKAPEVLESVKQQYLLVADSPNALVGKLVKYLIKNIEPEQTSDGKWKLSIPTYNQLK